MSKNRGGKKDPPRTNGGVQSPGQLEIPPGVAVDRRNGGADSDLSVFSADTTQIPIIPIAGEGAQPVTDTSPATADSLSSIPLAGSEPAALISPPSQMGDSLPSDGSDDTATPPGGAGPTTDGVNVEGASTSAEEKSKIAWHCQVKRGRLQRGGIQEAAGYKLAELTEGKLAGWSMSELTTLRDMLDEALIQHGLRASEEKVRLFLRLRRACINEVRNQVPLQVRNLTSGEVRQIKPDQVDRWITFFTAILPPRPDDLSTLEPPELPSAPPLAAGAEEASVGQEEDSEEGVGITELEPPTPGKGVGEKKGVGEEIPSAPQVADPVQAGAAHRESTSRQKGSESNELKNLRAWIEGLARMLEVTSHPSGKVICAEIDKKLAVKARELAEVQVGLQRVQAEAKSDREWREKTNKDYDDLGAEPGTLKERLVQLVKEEAEKMKNDVEKGREKIPKVADAQKSNYWTRLRQSNWGVAVIIALVSLAAFVTVGGLTDWFGYSSEDEESAAEQPYQSVIPEITLEK